MDHCTTQKDMFSRNKIVTIGFQYFKNVSGRLELPWKAKKHPSVRANNTYKCKTCLKKILSFERYENIGGISMELQ